jgi:predicted TIM-barrel fold metal-dependent hydrolase
VSVEIAGPSALPSFLQQRSTDEYHPLPYAARDRAAIHHVMERVESAAADLGRPATSIARDRIGTATGLAAINEVWQHEFYAVPVEAQSDPAAAEETFRGSEFVIDVQTHFMSPRARRQLPWDERLHAFYCAVMPDWWAHLDTVSSFDIAEFITTVFVETETKVAVLTSGPGIDDRRHLHNDEMYATRCLLEQFGGTGRLLNHAVVHPNVPSQVGQMAEWVESFRPVGWKVYTGPVQPPGGETIPGWRLDDEASGFPFLSEIARTGPRLLCVHKGLNGLVDNGTPEDVGAAAAAFPEIDFVVYHSGYELIVDSPPEGPFDESAPDHFGTDRLIAGCVHAGIAAGGNVHAELGSTWFALIRRPVDAAHVLGKLLVHFGEDNVLWGTDSIWYGSAQPLIDAFRAFDIPDELCERHGYPKLTPQIKQKILSDNAARLYGIDRSAVSARASDDDRSWARAALAEVREAGFAALRT